MHDTTAARESARRNDGRFGTQSRAEADIELADAPQTAGARGGYDAPIQKSDIPFELVRTSEEGGVETEHYEAKCSEELNAKIRTMLGVPEGAPVSVTKTATDYEPDGLYAEIYNEVEIRSGSVVRTYEDDSADYNNAEDKLEAAINAVGKEDFAAVTQRAKEAEGIGKFVVAQHEDGGAPFLLHVNNADGHQIYAATCQTGWLGGLAHWEGYDTTRSSQYAWVDDSPAARAAITPSLAWTDLSVRPGPWREDARRELHEQWLARQEGPVMVERYETDAERETRLRAWAEEMAATGDAPSVERALLNIRGHYVPDEKKHLLDAQTVEVDIAVPYDPMPEGLKHEHLPVHRTLEQAEKWFHASVDRPLPAEELAARFRDQHPEVSERDAAEAMHALLSRGNEVAPKFLTAVGPKTGRR